MLNTLKKRTLAASTTVLLLCAAVAHAAQPVVLQQVPDNATAVLAVKNLKQLTTKLANAGTRMKLPVPEDLLATLTGKYGISEGLDPNGSAALVVMEPVKDDKGMPVGPPQVVAILPASDPKAMIKSFEADTPDATGIMKVTLPGDEAGFAVITGKYVAMGPDHASLEKFVSRAGTLDKKLSADSAAAFDVNDMVLYLNMPLLAPSAQAGTDEWVEKLRTHMATPTTDKMLGALATEMINAMAGLTRQVLTDTQTAVVTFRLNDDEAVLGEVMEFKPESPLARFVAAQSAARPTNLDGLPAGKILFASSGQWNGNALGDVLKLVAANIAANPDIKEKQADLQKVLESQVAALRLSSGSRWAIYEPTTPANGLVNAVVLTDFSDPQKSLDYVLALSQLHMSNEAAGIKVEQQIQREAKTVKGVSFTKITMTDTVDDNAPPGARKTQENFKKIFGQDGLVMYSAVVGKQVLLVTGNDDQLLENAVAAAQTSDPALSNSAEIAAATKALQPDSLAALYMPVSRWVFLGMKTFGLSPAEPPAGKPAPLPLTVGMTAHGSAALLEMHIPMSTVIELSTTIQENMGGLIPRF